MIARATRCLTALAIAAVTASAAAEVASAKPTQRLRAERAPVAVAHTPPSGVSARYSGYPNGIAPGSACRSFAAAANAVVDQLEQDVLEDRETPYDANAVVEGILDAGRAFGCLFMTG